MDDDRKVQFVGHLKLRFEPPLLDVFRHVVVAIEIVADLADRHDLAGAAVAVQVLPGQIPERDQVFAREIRAVVRMHAHRGIDEIIPPGEIHTVK